ncbi:leucine-rich alpha-2-glycoprotein [Cygnus olor]|uniref:leucine-rich alpha-2-glycoprotein n=1 Tax=Cygnus olor TaxID=8869 RepID=UPI001ADE2352|nr:leucine-rich alpha-2-glycoprotein [Cygnus olor]
MHSHPLVDTHSPVRGHARTHRAPSPPWCAGGQCCATPTVGRWGQGDVSALPLPWVLAPHELAALAKAAISRAAREDEPPTSPGDGHHRRGGRTQGRQSRRSPADRWRSPTAMVPPGQILPPLLLLLLVVLCSPATPCPLQPNATRFVCTEPTLRSFPGGLPPSTLAVSVEFTSVTTLAPDALAGLPELQELHLASNLLATLPEELLWPVPALRVLDLTDNALAELPAGLFQRSDLLQHLVLRGNRLRALQPAWFGRLARLRWLDLGANALAEVPPEVFRPLVSLHSLDLSHNRLEGLDAGALAGLRELERLDLEGNRLRALPPDAFAPVPALRLLFLQGNELRALPAGLFAPLSHLHVLDLAHNRLRALELPPRPPGPLLSLDISGNPWACECLLLELLRHAAPQLVAARGTLCASPPHHQGQEVAALSQAGDAGCQPDEEGQSLPDP